jgi:hypothetical protein
MSFRKYVDDEGRSWQVRPVSRGEWRFEPLPGNAAPARSVRAPSWQEDPFELSREELGRLLGSATPRPGPTRRSPFKD